MRQTDKLEMITKVLNEKSVPIPLQDAVLKHFRNYFKDVSAFDVDGMLDRLPHSLANEVQLFHHEWTLKNISFLKYIDNVTIRLYIFHLMKPVYMNRTNTSFREGEPGFLLSMVYELSLRIFLLIGMVTGGVLQTTEVTKNCFLTSYYLFRSFA